MTRRTVIFWGILAFLLLCLLCCLIHAGAIVDTIRLNSGESLQVEAPAERSVEVSQSLTIGTGETTPSPRVDSVQRQIDAEVEGKTIEFALDSWIISEGGTELLNRIAGILGRHPDLHIQVQGHTDVLGEEAYNLYLSQQRADAVRDYLVAKGVPGDQITSAGLGSSMPQADNATREGRRTNRRIEFHVRKGQ
ncbi:MAG: OmpA family protein [Bacteroidota bacterium]